MIRVRAASSPDDQPVYLITVWPDADPIEGGPYRSFGYALFHARAMLTESSARIWRDRAKAGEREQLEEIAPTA